MYRSLHFRYSDQFPMEFDEEDNAVGPGARALAEMIVSALGEHGVETGCVEQHSYYGWGFTTELRSLAFFNVVHPIRAEGHLTVDFGLVWLKALFGKRPRQTFDEYCELVSASVSSIPGISSVGWGKYSS